MKAYRITVNGTAYDVEVEEIGSAAAAPAAPAAAPAKPAPKAAPAAAPAANVAGTKVSAPMPGTVLKVNVTVGAQVKKGDLVLVLEAMKMENEIFAPCDGKVVAVSAGVGTAVNSGDTMLVIG